MKIESKNLIDGKIYYNNRNFEKAIEKIELLNDYTDEDKLIKWTNFYFLYNSIGDFTKADIYLNMISEKDITIMSRIKGNSVLNLLKTNGSLLTTKEITELEIAMAIPKRLTEKKSIKC